MGSWLKRQQPVTLHQASEVPFVILEDGVYLCFDNCYEEKHAKSSHSITFKVDRNKLSRISTNYYRLRDFPAKIPFDDIVRLDNTVIDGKIIKHASVSTEDTERVIVAVDSYLDGISSQSFDDLIEDMDHVDHTFILIGESSDPVVRIFEDMSHIIVHYDWYKTSVEIADSIYKHSHRKYCWTSSLPPINLHYYGLSSSDDSDQIHRVVSDIGLQNCSIIWEG